MKSNAIASRIKSLVTFKIAVTVLVAVIGVAATLVLASSIQKIGLISTEARLIALLAEDVIRLQQNISDVRIKGDKASEEALVHTIDKILEEEHVLRGNSGAGRFAAANRGAFESDRGIPACVRGLRRRGSGLGSRTGRISPHSAGGQPHPC